jgi:DNA-binding MarR family transcriptional regulator
VPLYLSALRLVVIRLYHGAITGPRMRERVKSVHPDRQVVRLLSHAERYVTHGLGEVLAAHDISVPEWWVLTLLSDSEGHTMSEIADFALVPSPTLTRIIDALVADNLVYRRIDDFDRRRVLVFATHRGQVLYQQLQRAVARYEQQLCGGVDTRSLTELLTQLIAITGLPGRDPARQVPGDSAPSRPSGQTGSPEENGSGNEG